MFESNDNFFTRWLNRKKFGHKGLFGSRRRRTEDSELATAAEHSMVLGCFMLVLVWGTCLLLLALSGSHRHEVERLVLGQIAPRTINVAFDFVYEDREATARARAEAGQASPLFFRISDEENKRIRQAVKLFVSTVATGDWTGEAAGAEPRSVALTRPAAKPDERLIKAVSDCSGNPAAYLYFEDKLNDLLAAGIFSYRNKSSLAPGQQIRIIDLLQRERLPQRATLLPDEYESGRLLATAMLHFHPKDADYEPLQKKLSAIFREQIGSAGNLVYAEARTESGRRTAAESTAAVTHEFKKHHPLVVKGELVNEDTLEKLKAYAEVAAEQGDKLEDWSRNIDNIFWSIALVIMSGFYLYHIHPDVVKSNRNIAIVGSVVLLSLLFNYAGIEIFNFILRESKAMSPTMVTNAVPIALVAVLMSAFMGLRVAIGTGFFVASITAMMLDLSFDFALKGVVICAMTSLAVRHSTDYRSFFMRTVLSVFPLVWILNANLLSTASDWRSLGDIAVRTGYLALGNGLFTAFVALLLVFLYELMLKVSTNMSLMVQCDYNHPLLERMKREAPGTFFHSLMVATLAEDAARAINANPLKAKTGALYHDIGKLFKPQYFTENNQETGNQHTALTPHMSSLIIRDHVKEGLELARRYKLGRVIRDAIEQHHGNDLVWYFYRKALEHSKETGEPVSEAEFRYHGQPPRSKETAIISLADACEAACRSLDRPSSARIEALVSEIFLKRFQEGQLVDADMTLAELEKVKESFINTLLSMKHGRIAYHLKDCNGNKLRMATAPKPGGAPGSPPY